MHVWAAILGAVIILSILLDAFETIVLPRRVQRGFRLTALFYRNTWRPWARAAQYIRKPTRRETFFTLGYGDITPNNTAARVLAVMEAGMGFAFLGVVIGYLPVVYSAFTTREIEISLLDARAGSPPSAAEFLGRLGCCPEQTVLDDIFRDWERWCADLLSTHISYPVLVFFRSQHSNQSWLGALTAMLDVTSLVMTGVGDIHPDQAKLTFAMARHAVVDLAQVVNARYHPHEEADRLSPAE